jgi:hypothetical protein
MERPEWAPDKLDLDRPSAARMYDYYLGGSHNFAADRELARQVLSVFPDGQAMAQANRAFLFRAVRFAAGCGVRQFLDLGSGIPTAGNVHEVAQAVVEAPRVVYVDVDPVAVAHSEAILAGNASAGAVLADLRDPDAVLSSPVTRRMLDFGRPMALLMVAVLHFVSDADDPAGIVAAYRRAMPPGSLVVIAHGTADSRPGESDRLVRLYRDTGYPMTLRTRAEVEGLFAGCDLVEPGVVWVPQWHPDWPDEVGVDPSWCGNLGGVARTR